MMKRLTFMMMTSATLLLMCLQTTTSASLMINPTTGILGTTRFEVITNGNADINALTGYAGTLTEAYKATPGSNDEGPFAGSYNTVFTTEGANDYDGGLISWVNGQPSISKTPVYLFVKDGSPRPQYAFDITGWNGTESIDFSSFYVGGGSISHVSIFVGDVDPGNPPVPEPATMVIWSLLGCVGLAVHRWKKSS